MTVPSAAGESRDLPADAERAEPAATPAAMASVDRVRSSTSPVYGAATVALSMLSTLTLITYTLIPLPGQRSLGWWNYLIAAGLFVSAIALGPIFEAREDPTPRRS